MVPYWYRDRAVLNPLRKALFSICLLAALARTGCQPRSLADPENEELQEDYPDYKPAQDIVDDEWIARSWTTPENEELQNESQPGEAIDFSRQSCRQ